MTTPAGAILVSNEEVSPLSVVQKWNQRCPATLHAVMKTYVQYLEHQANPAMADLGASQNSFVVQAIQEKLTRELQDPAVAQSVAKLAERSDNPLALSAVTAYLEHINAQVGASAAAQQK